MKNEIINREILCIGTQQEVAAAITAALWPGIKPNATMIRLFCDYFKTQRQIRKLYRKSNVFTYNGIGIDITPRAMACWIEDAETVRRFRESALSAKK